MIKIGIDISPMLITALENNIIDIDFVEVNGSHSMERLYQAQKYRPVIIHDVSTKFWLNYENAFSETDMLAHCHDLLEAAKPEWFSTGIGASAEPQGHTSPYWRGADDSQLQSRQKVHDNIMRNAKELQDWLDIPLLLENYNYHPTNAYEYVCEPAFFSEVVQDVGCGMLLDIPHSIISAYNMKHGDVISYMKEFPLDKVREVHIAHPKLDPEIGQMLDMHMPIDDSDLPILRWVLENTPVEALTLEVQDDVTPEQLADQARMLREVTSKIG